MNKGSTLTRFTPEQIAWLREHAQGTPFEQLTDEFNRVFGQSRSRTAIVSACFYRGFGNGLKSKNLEDLEVKGKKYRFKPGYVPPNKGVKGYSTNDPRPSWPSMRIVSSTCLRLRIIKMS